MNKKHKFWSRPRKHSSPDVLGEDLGGEHEPVLLRESIDGLAVKEDGIYVDATFGRGGHSSGILQRLGTKGMLLCIDKDQEAIQKALQISDKRLIVRQGSFANIKSWINELDYSGKVNGILLDLGVSSPQLDSVERGFSFLHDGPLDMRMDQEQLLDAASWLSRAKEHEIAWVLKEYGEERFSKRIAHAIVQERAIAPIVTTGRLAEIVKKANPKWEEYKHPATRAFQAIRIFINNELQELRDCLEQCLDVLAIGGRLVVISFHSLEDRIVKQFMQKHIRGHVPEGVPLRDIQLPRRFERIGRAIHASAEEINNNPRSRSAVLRIVEKLK
ncbi:16S rRNA m(4)C1402 methyltransferase [Gammaproteobacteria bacterium]